MIVTIGTSTKHCISNNMELPSLPVDKRRRLWVIRDLADWVADASSVNTDSKPYSKSR